MTNFKTRNLERKAYDVYKCKYLYLKTNIELRDPNVG